MSLRVRIRGDVKAVTRDLDRVQRKVVPAAVARALNRTGSRARTRAVRAAAAELGIKQALIRRRFALRRARRARQSVSLIVGLLPIPVDRLGRARQTKRGVSVGRRRYPGAFVQTIGSDRRALRRRGAERYPIERVRLEVGATEERHAEREIHVEGAEFFRRELERDLAFRLARRGR